MATSSVAKSRGGPVAVVASATALILTFVPVTPAHVAAGLCAVVAVVAIGSNWRRATARSEHWPYVVALVILALTVLLWCIAFASFHALSGKG